MLHFLYPDESQATATKVKSHDYLVLMTSGLLQRAVQLGLPDMASRTFVQAVDSLCAAWKLLLSPSFVREVRLSCMHSFS